MLVWRHPFVSSWIIAKETSAKGTLDKINSGKTWSINSENLSHTIWFCIVDIVAQNYLILVKVSVELYKKEELKRK